MTFFQGVKSLLDLESIRRYNNVINILVKGIEAVRATCTGTRV